MFRYLLLVFLIVVFLLSGYDWYYFKDAQSAFNTGMYFVLICWCMSLIKKGLL